MTAYVFPGQGAQYPGMGKDLFDISPLAQSLYKQADDVLGYPLTDTMFNGSEEKLRKTKYTQPAIFVHSVVTYLVADRERDLRPDAVAGHSLGEYSALVASGALSFPDGLRLVRERALAMQAASEQRSGTMAAVLGLDGELVTSACDEIDGVVAANFNSPGQLVISGTEEGIETAEKVLSGLGARRIVRLNVGGAFHSPLMEPARTRLEEAIQEVRFSPPGCEIYQNVDAEPSLDPENIKRKLSAQLTAPVRWTQTVNAMRTAGVTDFVEVGGKGKVLAGLIRKTDRELGVTQLSATS